MHTSVYKIRIPESVRLAAGHPVQPPAQAGKPRAGCPGPWVPSEDLQGRRLQSLSGQPVPVLDNPHSKQVLPI